MKKKYLTYAGIISALVLAGMFIGILLTGVPIPFMPPSTTIDPITDMSVDEHNILLLTGTTTLAKDNTLYVRLTASPRSPGQDDTDRTVKVNSDAWIIPGEGGNNRLKGTIDISPVQPGDYTISLATVTYTKNFTMIESDPIATQHFTLGDENAGPGSVRKKTRVTEPFIRINPTGQTRADGDLKISGITSLAPGIPLAWNMQAVANGSGNDTQVFQGTAVVVRGTEGINRWNVVPGTGEITPVRYQFRISENTTGTTSPVGTLSALYESDNPPVSATRQNTTGPVNISAGFVTIDALPTMRTGEVYVLTGTTSLSPGEEIMMQVYPASGFDLLLDKNKGQTGDFSGAAAMTTVAAGSGGENLWSFELQTYHFEADQYIVTVNNDSYDFEAGAFVPGALSCSRKFTLGG
ncbi:MAG: hypothetical protein LUQ66_10110 [Methanoregula sp.]|nr:hypothetical protein [Methanoregula sp.]